ncbi:DUF6318 family protein [Kribbella sindirgiensis]|uniref:DUF6318 domain-containing protein n=1 Tax=Kribbella sindirgiensis TaxID=1124744 RepID=A0A4R0I921_9ACTN|nr:DUF6318 family protein [Kribbella sindirgiensis]TCC26367.1 hypothetical protein E0H50_30990 [Kribbella sindirgiensis]
MTHRNRPIITLLACLTTTALLTSCTQKSPEAGHPNTAPPPATSASSATPTESAAAPSTPSGPPERPANAKGLTLAAAEQFVRYYSELLNYASETGDTAPMLSNSEAGCESCKSYAGFVAKANAANGLLKGDYREQVTDVPDLFRGAGGHLGGSANVSVGAYVSQETKTSAPISVKAAKYKREFGLSVSHGNWVMYEMELVKQ